MIFVPDRISYKNVQVDFSFEKHFVIEEQCNVDVSVCSFERRHSGRKSTHFWPPDIVGHDCSVQYSTITP